MPVPIFSPLSLVLFALSAFSLESVSTRTARDISQFISVGSGSQSTQILKNGQPFRFNGTNAYWLATLENDSDIENTMHSISASGIQVVRIWAFNDVTEIPENGVWFQLIANGATYINTGPNGLQRLDKVVAAAENEGISLIMSLTNNWNPKPLVDNTPLIAIEANVRRDDSAGTGNNLPRNMLSNDYGGMDAYVREFGVTKMHDEFYTNKTIINIFQNYSDQVVKRYLDSPAILSWEIANDARCNSSIPATQHCNTSMVTSWHATMANHIKAVDTNHLISSGVQGFQCLQASCTKLFKTSPPPKTRIKHGLHEEGKDMLIPKALMVAREVPNTNPGCSIGQGVHSPADPSEDLGSVYDGSFGVDSEDIMFIDSIGFGSFQLFPDQLNYARPGTNLTFYNETIIGSDWIGNCANLIQIVAKPIVLTGFGLVTQRNSGSFVPFNGTIAPFDTLGAAKSNTGLPPFGITDVQQDDVYSFWVDYSFENGVAGVIQYQWGEGDLTAQQGTNIVSSIGSNGQAVSPNDGYQRVLAVAASSASTSPSTTPKNASAKSTSILKHSGAAAGVFTAVALTVIAVLVVIYHKLIRRRRLIGFGQLGDGDEGQQTQARWRHDMEITPFSDPCDTRGFVNLIPEVTHRSQQGSMEFPAPPLDSSESPPPYRTNTSAASDMAEQEVLPVARSTSLRNGAKVGPLR